MKPIKRLSVFIILLGIILLNTTCTKKRWFSTVTWEGTVYHKNGLPASGIEMILNARDPGDTDGASILGSNEFTAKTTTSDVAGHFRIHCLAARSDTYCPSLSENYGSNLDFPSQHCDVPGFRLTTDSAYTIVRLLN
jgi:hypothetical protein